MVKKKGKSKRTSLKDKYKIERRVVQKHRKDRKEAKKNPGKFNNKSKKDPGIPNSWPFKEEVRRAVDTIVDTQIVDKTDSRNIIAT